MGIVDRLTPTGNAEFDTMNEVSSTRNEISLRYTAIGLVVGRETFFGLASAINPKFLGNYLWPITAIHFHFLNTVSISLNLILFMSDPDFYISVLFNQ
jgi:hypothetical protein